MLQGPSSALTVHAHTWSNRFFGALYAVARLDRSTTERTISHSKKITFDCPTAQTTALGAS